MIPLNFNPAAQLEVPTGMPTNETNAEIETVPVAVETNTRNVHRNAKNYTLFYAFH